MDASRFDRLTRAFSRGTPRRTLFAPIAGGLLAALSLAQRPDGASARKRNKKKRRKKLGCATPCAECRRCQKGKCVEDNGVACGNSLCKECQGGVCGNRPNNTNCNGTGKCVNGTCNPAPACSARGTVCLKANHTCCSGECAGAGPTTGTCATSELGEPCITNADCNPGIVGFNFCNLSFACEEPVIEP